MLLDILFVTIIYVILNNVKGELSMSIIIKRNTGWVGSGSLITVKINGEKVAKIAHNQEIEIAIPECDARMTVSQSAATSNELKVTGNKVIEITSTKWAKFSPFLPAIILIFSTLISNPMYKLTSIALVFLFIIIAAFLMKYFHLEVLDKKDEQ